MANYAKMDEKYKEMFDTIEKVRAYLEPIANNICGETGLNCDYSTDNLYYPTTGHFNFYLQGEYFGKIFDCMDYNKSTEENIVIEVRLMLIQSLKCIPLHLFLKQRFLTNVRLNGKDNYKEILLTIKNTRNVWIG